MSSCPKCRAFLVLAGLGLVIPVKNDAAQDIYRCEIAGKVAYTADGASNPDCRLMRMSETGPSPEELARIMEEKARKAAEEQAEEQQAKENARLNAELRSASAQEREAEAARRRAQVAEEELRLMKEGTGYPRIPPYGGFYPGLSGSRVYDQGQFGGYPPNLVPPSTHVPVQPPIPAAGAIIGKPPTNSASHSVNQR